ncbi:twin-arginine translocase TatA/TatE family subunit [Brevibacillus fulvus]|uniref:Sec-independent protein translocase protein TatA n=1 Tax=Brevibacillus fulvus TaxID=1125967 RepID=A0A938Y1Q6_9BACL|nr:twin-arginine translocase TatA/TatE family subunit [Brevibacillus fulvus]MBM7591568.1 sec-independent protein translocase protein TatA [Brevibacillus fulvus]
MDNIGFPGMILLLILALVLFGPKKLPELGRTVGLAVREFRNAARSVALEEQASSKDAAAQPAAGDDIPAAERAKIEQEVRERLEAEIRERLERERLEKEIRDKLEMERMVQQNEQGSVNR